MTISLLLHTNTNNIIASPKSRNTEKMLWFSEIRRKFGKISCKSVAVLNHSNLIHDGSTKEEDDYRVASFTDKGTGYCQDDESNGKSRKVLTLEDLAAIKIQTCFRGHLARRAFRALKGLVKLQALVRGASVRRQARIAVQCMQAMVRLQVKVRARQLLRNSGDLELLQP